jgi:PKD repeat protein
LPAASFSIAPVSGVTNTFAATAGTTGVFSWYWDAGDGAGLQRGAALDTLYYGKKGNYRVTLTVLGHGGYDTVSQVVQVAQDDTGVSVIQGGSLSSASDWTVLNTGGTQTTFSFTAQGMNMSNTGNSNGAVYQAVQVKAGVKYTFSANVQGSGASNSWVEFYIGATAPTQGSDYGDGKYYSLNTWAGCGGSSFSGNITTLSCSGSGASNGQVSFGQTGTMYVLIKAGSSGGTLGASGVTVTGIRLSAPSH